MSLIMLIGVIGSGKATVGCELSRRRELPLYEVDAAVEGCFDTPMCILVVGRGPYLATTVCVGVERLLGLNEGVITLSAPQLLDSAITPSTERTCANGVLVIESSVNLSAVSRQEGLGTPCSVGLGASRAMLTQLMKRTREIHAPVADTTADTGDRTP